LDQGANISSAALSRWFTHFFFERFTKCGFVGESEPRCIVRTPPAPPSNTRGDGRITLPTYEAWCAMLQTHLNRIYFEHLLVNPRDQSILVLEDPYWSYTQKRAVFNTLLKLGAKSVAMLWGSGLPIYLCGRSRSGKHGLVLDIGYSACRAVCVVERQPILASLQVSPTAAQQVWYPLPTVCFVKSRSNISEWNRFSSACAPYYRHASTPRKQAL
jgi:hypothetical protein